MEKNRGKDIKKDKLEIYLLKMQEDITAEIRNKGKEGGVHTMSKFIKLKCAKCRNEQMVFNRPASKINCLVCNEPLAEPTGGRAKILIKEQEVAE